jgi:stage V sporulation protein R
MEFTLNDLEKWNEKIEEIASRLGLDYYPQEFEVIGYNEMLGYEAYSGMPSRYPHWSFGKSYEKSKTLYDYNLTGLPYEMVINSNPCLGYLMRDNTLLLQILTMAHVYGHNDFFKNNRLFIEGTDASQTVEMLKRNADKVRSYINDPSIGYEKVERILNAAHALRFQVSRIAGEKKKKYGDSKEELEDDLLYFIIKNSTLEEWEKNLVEIVRNESLYFIPQIETKIMNEGWASYWHYTILNELKLPQGLHLEFIKRHNDVVRPHLGSINPYYLGFLMFQDIERRYGRDKIFEVRALERDSSFIRRYLTYELCAEANLFQYGEKGNDYVIEEISDEQGWKMIRNTISSTCGMGSIPVIKVADVDEKTHVLTIEHVYDGRELLVNYAHSTLKYVQELWFHPVELKTIMSNQPVILRSQ